MRLVLKLSYKSEASLEGYQSEASLEVELPE